MFGLWVLVPALTAIEVIPVLPEWLRSFFNKIQARQDRKNRFSFHVASFTDQFMSTCAAFDQVTFSITDALTPWMCGQEPFARLVLSV